MEEHKGVKLPSDSVVTTEISGLLNIEQELNESYKVIEKQRHKKKMADIREKAEIDGLINKRKQVEERVKDYKEITKKVKKFVHQFTAAAMPRQRTSFRGIRLTIRDGAVYSYGRSSKLNVGSVTAKLLKNMRAIAEKTNDESTFKEVISFIEDNLEWKEEKYTEHSLTKPEISLTKQKKVITVSLKSYREGISANIKEKNQKYSGKSFSRNPSSIKQIMLYLTNDKFLADSLAAFEDKLGEMIENRKEVLEKAQKKGSSIMFLNILDDY